MVGLGEQRLEVHQVMDDMRSAGVDFLTMGQYLQPTPKHAKVEEFVTPQAFDAYAAIARAKGFLLVAASPLTRSSYHAGDDFKQMQAAATRSWSERTADAASQRDASTSHIRPNNCSNSSRTSVAMTSSCRGSLRSGSARPARRKWSPTWSSASTPSRSDSPAAS